MIGGGGGDATISRYSVRICRFMMINVKKAIDSLFSVRYYVNYNRLIHVIEFLVSAYKFSFLVQNIIIVFYIYFWSV